MKRYVYLIQSLENSYYKIGVSKHPNKRVSELKTGNPSPTKLITTYLTEYPTKIETALHNRYSHYHKDGEWYDLSLNIEVDFINECKKIEENIIFLERNNNIFI